MGAVFTSTVDKLSSSVKWESYTNVFLFSFSFGFSVGRAPLSFLNGSSAVEEATREKDSLFSDILSKYISFRKCFDIAPFS